MKISPFVLAFISEIYSWFEAFLLYFWLLSKRCSLLSRWWYQLTRLCLWNLKKCHKEVWLYIIETCLQVVAVLFYFTWTMGNWQLEVWKFSMYVFAPVVSFWVYHKVKNIYRGTWPWTTQELTNFGILKE